MKKLIFISKSLNLDDLLSTNPPKFIYKKDNFAVIINLISEIPLKCKDSFDGKFIPIPAKKIQSITSDYRLYLDYLIKNNVIESDNTYIKGEKPKGYNYTATFKTDLAPYYVTDSTLIKKIAKHDLFNFDKSNKLKYLSKWYDDKLQINYIEAKAKNKEIYVMNLILDIDNAYNKFAHADLSIEKLNNHKYIFHRDNTSYRIHSNLTVLNKQFRPYITYDNQSLVSLDFSNSQPFLSSVLFTNSFYDKNHSGLNLYKLNRSIYNEMYNNHAIRDVLKYISNIQIDSDIFEFINNSVSGNIYEYILNIFNNIDNINSYSREDIKKMMFSVLFSNNHFLMQQNAIYKKTFSEQFPDVYNVFKIIKRKNNSRLPILLQSIESYLLIDNICKYIYKHYPNLPIYTIHDSIITLKGYEFKLKPIIESITKQIIGHTPVIKLEYWSLQNE